jgi:tetratricopeptide (TPR) repeat protein
MDKNDRYGALADNYTELGVKYLNRGDLAKAIDYHEKALVIHKALGKKDGMANSYGNLGIVYESLNQIDTAVEYWQKSLALFKEIGAVTLMAKVEAWLGEAVAVER